MEQKIKPITFDNENKQLDKEKQKNENMILDSPTIDNESKLILFKYNNIPIEANEKKINEKKDIISHDKEIMEDSIIYFTQKLKKINIEYHKYLYISIGLYLIDFIFWYIDKTILHTYFNLYSLIKISFVAIIQVYAFKHNFESISKEIYIFTQRIIYIYCFALILFILNMIYIFFFKIILNSVDINNVYQKKMLNFFCFSLIIVFFYIIINCVIPIIVLVNLISIRRNIKNLSAAKGEVYETVKIKDSQIINSIIN